VREVQPEVQYRRDLRDQRRSDKNCHVNTTLQYIETELQCISVQKYKYLLDESRPTLCISCDQVTKVGVLFGNRISLEELIRESIRTSIRKCLKI
jgi:hypothetical protein